MSLIQFTLCRHAARITAALSLFGAGPTLPTVAQAEPVAEIVGPGIVSTPVREFAVALAPQADVLYFNRQGESGTWQIWSTPLQDGGFGTPSPLWFSDGRYFDADPFISRSGDRLYFSSDRPPPGSASTEPTPDTNTWYAPWMGDRWGAPVFASTAINTPASETYVSESAAGELIFIRFGEGEGRARPAYMMIAERDGAGFKAPSQLETQPAGLRLTNPAISPDGRTIIAAARDGGPPQLYMSRNDAAGTWGSFVHLPEPYNVEGYRSFAPYIANDGFTLYFSSDRPSEAGGADDLYRARLPATLSGDDQD